MTPQCNPSKLLALGALVPQEAFATTVAGAAK